MTPEIQVMALDRLFGHWSQVRSGLMETIDKFRTEDLSFIPYPSSWSVGEIMTHIANAELGWFQFVAACELAEWPDDYSPDLRSTPESIKTVLEEVHTWTEGYLADQTIADLGRQIELPWRKEARLSLEWIIWHVIEHEIHHRGELSMILGLLGREGLDV